MLEQASSRWKNKIGRSGADHDQFDLAGGDAGRFHRHACRTFGQIARGLAVGRDVALTNARARGDPFVAGVDQLFELGVGDDPFRKTAAGSGDACVNQSEIPRVRQTNARQRLGAGSFVKPFQSCRK
jgi:hypothetical protein